MKLIEFLQIFFLCLFYISLLLHFSLIIMLHLFWDWFYLLTFSCSLWIITVNACLNYEINIYIFSVIFLSNFKYFLIKLLNLIKDDHRHALNADVLYYLLNIELSNILYISIIFKVFKVVFIVCFIKTLMIIF